MFKNNTSTKVSFGRLTKKYLLAGIATAFPLSPTPVSGFVLFLPKEKMKILDISVATAIKIIFSGGVVSS